LPHKKEPMTEQNWPATSVALRPIDDLVPYARNARTHSEGQVDRIAASIAEFGFTNPILVTERGTIVAGHGRALAAKKLGLEQVPVMVATGWTEPQMRAYVLADNRLALDAGWDEDLLRVELEDLDLEEFDLDLTGFDGAEIERLLEDRSALEEPETIPEPPEDPVANLGDVWRLGRHTVVCGDSTDPATWERLLNGAKPRLMVTDPPYGVEYDPEWRIRVGVNDPDGDTAVGVVENDDRADWFAVWSLFPGDVAYVWHAGLAGGVVFDSLVKARFDVRSQIVWVKPRGVFSRSHYHWGHEPAFYAVRRGGKAHWTGDRKQATTWEIPITKDGDRTGHSTQKPLECMARPMRNHDAEEVVDPFLGSGSTLIAAEIVGRTCYGIELNPAYVDVIVQRWEARTGEKAELIHAGAAD
jgi:DNA modification methylase